MTVSLPGGAGPSMAQIVNQVATEILADDPPPTEAVAAKAGVAPKARRRDAQSARLTSSTYDEFTTPGSARVMFTRNFMRRPGCVFTAVESADNGAPVIVVRQYLKNTAADGQPAVYAAWGDADQDVNPIVGCDAYGYRINPRTPTVPAQPVLNLLSFVFGTVQGLLDNITNTISNKPTTTPIAAGTKFTTIAVASSQGASA